MTSAFFHRKSATFVISINRNLDCVLTHNPKLLTIYESLEVVLIDMDGILMISAKSVTLALLKIKIFKAS